MELSVISFTENGMRLSERIARMLESEPESKPESGLEPTLEAKLYTKCGACRRSLLQAENAKGDQGVRFVEGSVGAWAGERMRRREAMLFIGACGIAVRAVAPFLADKAQDPPVLVMDEKGKYVIPILSGHLGGANELAEVLAEQTGAVPVITTATDLNGRFAVDLFARQNGLYLADKSGIVKVSAKALAEQEIAMSIEPGCGIGLCPPQGVRLAPYPPAGCADVLITSKEETFGASVVLRPREYLVGLGCKAGKKADEIGDLVARTAQEAGILMPQILALASIAQKQDEPGIIEWCRRAGVDFLTYTAEELREVPGEFAESAFVEAQVGVGNVCERAALKACGAGGELVVSKRAENGMTIAVAKRSKLSASLSGRRASGEQTGGARRRADWQTEGEWHESD